MSEKYVTVLIKCQDLQPGGGYWRKYRNVIYTEQKLQSLYRYLARNGVNWSHMNLYSKDKRSFIEQIKNK